MAVGDSVVVMVDTVGASVVPVVGAPVGSCVVTAASVGEAVTTSSSCVTAAVVVVGLEVCASGVVTSTAVGAAVMFCAIVVLFVSDIGESGVAMGDWGDGVVPTAIADDSSELVAALLSLDFPTTTIPMTAPMAPKSKRQQSPTIM